MSSMFMRRVLIWGLAIAALVLVGVVGLLEVSKYSLVGECEETVAARFTQPAGTRQIVVMVTTCGATTADNTAVFVRRVGDPEEWRDDYIFSVKGSNNIEVAWEPVWNPRRANLTIIHDPVDEYYRQVTVWNGEHFAYRERAIAK